MAVPSVKILSRLRQIPLEITFSLPPISLLSSDDTLRFRGERSAEYRWKKRGRERERGRASSEYRGNNDAIVAGSREIGPEIHPTGVRDEKKRNRKTGGLPRRLQIDLVYTLLTEREKRGGGGWRRKGAWVASLSLVDATLARCIEMERGKRLYLRMGMIDRIIIRKISSSFFGKKKRRSVRSVR